MMSQEMTVEQFCQIMADVEGEVGQAIVGQRDTIRHLLVGLLAGGHILLESVPGLGKTVLMHTLAQVLDLSFARLQLTPDLMPEDIVGSGTPAKDSPRRWQARFHTGTLCANLVLADEVNRAAPRTQSTLLEAMQTQTIPIGGRTHPLPQPFLVVASQNPFESEGIHPLSQAQVDHFLFKLDVAFPGADELGEILELTASDALAEVRAVADGPTVLRLAERAREVVLADEVRDYTARLLLATHPGQPTAPEAVRRYVRRGAGPRGAQAMIRGAQVLALLDGRLEMAIEDIRSLALPALRHRVFLNGEGQAEGLTADDVLETVLAAADWEEAE
jgi:MoxR-like ATPase